MTEPLKSLRLTADELALVHSALHNLEKGMQALRDADQAIDPSVRKKAAAMANEISALQAKIIKETCPDMADHVDEIQAKAAAAKLEADRCTCRHSFYGTGGGRQEVRIADKKCPVHARPRHLKAV